MYFMKAALALLFAVYLVVPNNAIAEPLREAEKEVISAFLKSIDSAPNSRDLLILDSRTVYFGPFPPHTEPEAAKWMPQASRPVVKDFLRVALDRTALDGTPALTLPASRWQMVDGPDLDRMFDGDGGWKKFYAKYPNASRLIRVSRAGIDEESQQALFLISASSGPVSGLAYFVLLHRINGEWLVLATEQAWIS